MKKLLDLFIIFYSKTIAKWSVPYSHKKFKLLDYFKIKKLLDDHIFAIGLVTTYGSGSNIGIKFTNKLSKDPRKKKSNKTHLIIIFKENNNYFVAEQIGTGFQIVTLLEAIGQRDEVTIRVPIKKYIADPVAKAVLEYIYILDKEDKKKNIEYDMHHVLDDDFTSDCSGLLWQALQYAFEKYGQENLLITIDRLGKETFAPVDAEFSKLFKTIYDDGFVS